MGAIDRCLLLFRDVSQNSRGLSSKASATDSLTVLGHAVRVILHSKPESQKSVNQANR